MHNLQMYPVSLRFLRAAHTLQCLAGYFLFPSPPPPTTIFSSFCIPKSPESLPGGSCLGPLGVVCFSDNWRSSELDSLWFWTSDIQDLPTWCRKFLYFTFLFVFSVLYTKIALKSAQFSRYSTTFFFLPFYSFPQNWVITDILVYPVYAFHEFIVLNNSIGLLYFFVFLSSRPVFTVVASWIILIICTSLLSFHTCTITSPFLRNADSPFFKHLPSPSRSHGMPLLALIVPQTLTFLSSNVWANLTLL